MDNNSDCEYLIKLIYRHTGNVKDIKEYISKIEKEGK